MVMNLSKYKFNSRPYHNTCIRHMKVHLHIPPKKFQLLQYHEQWHQLLCFFVLLFCFAFSRFAYLASYKSKFPDISLTLCQIQNSLTNFKIPWLSPDLEEIKFSLTCVNPAGTSWGQQKETLLMTYKAVGRSIVNYAAPTWHQLQKNPIHTERGSEDRYGMSQDVKYRSPTHGSRNAES